MKNSLIESFLEMLIAERAAAKNTVSSYRQDLEDFRLFILPTAFEEVSSQQVVAYLNEKASQGISVQTQSRRLSALRQFYRFLVSEQILLFDPTESVDKPKASKPLPKTLSQKDVECLLEAAAQQKSPQGYRLLVLLELLYATGLRVSELVSLPVSAFPQKMDDLRERPYLIIKGKGGKERLVPLTEAAINALKLYKASIPETQSPWLFPSRSKEGYLTRHRFFQLLKELAMSAGLSPEKVSPHIIRHAFATHLLQGGADLLSIQKLLGHADISTTQIYTHVAKDHLVEVVMTHHPLAKESK